MSDTTEIQTFETMEFSQEQKMFVSSAVEGYKQQLKRANCSQNEKTLAMLEAIDEINQDNFNAHSDKPSCRKGCAHCCYIQVGSTGYEVDLILDYMKKNNMMFTQEQISTLEKQAAIPDDAAYILSPDRRCVFLKENNECGIYPVRPATCRNYYVFNDPEDCNTFNHNNSGRTLVHFDINTMPPIITLMDISEVNSLPRLLIKKDKF